MRREIFPQDVQFNTQPCEKTLVLHGPTVRLENIFPLSYHTCSIQMEKTASASRNTWIFPFIFHSIIPLFVRISPQFVPQIVSLRK